jgi:hypothetical protein
VAGGLLEVSGFEYLLAYDREDLGEEVFDVFFGDDFGDGFGMQLF